MGGNSVTFMAICGDDFWDLLIAHPEVRATYLSYRRPLTFAIRCVGNLQLWRHHLDQLSRHRRRFDRRGSGASKAKFFPVGAGIFQAAYAPAERFEFVNTPGQPAYSWIVTIRCATCGPTWRCIPIRCWSAPCRRRSIAPR
jgi:hypothetical protein